MTRPSLLAHCLLVLFLYCANLSAHPRELYSVTKTIIVESHDVQGPKGSTGYFEVTDSIQAEVKLFEDGSIRIFVYDRLPLMSKVFYEGELYIPPDNGGQQLYEKLFQPKYDLFFAESEGQPSLKLATNIDSEISNFNFIRPGPEQRLVQDNRRVRRSIGAFGEDLLNLYLLPPLSQQTYKAKVEKIFIEGELAREKARRARDRRRRAANTLNFYRNAIPLGVVVAGAIGMYLNYPDSPTVARTAGEFTGWVALPYLLTELVIETPRLLRKTTNFFFGRGGLRRTGLLTTLGLAGWGGWDFSENQRLDFHEMESRMVDGTEETKWRGRWFIEEAASEGKTEIEKILNHPQVQEFTTGCESPFRHLGG